MHPHERPSTSVRRRGSAAPGSDPLRCVVWVAGDHEYATRASLSDTIARAARLDDSGVIVDLSGVTFMDASTIGALVEAHNRLGERAHKLSVRDPPRLARRLLEVCSLEFLIEAQSTAPTGATALASWVGVPSSKGAAAPREPVISIESRLRKAARSAVQPMVSPLALHRRRTPS